MAVLFGSQKQARDPNRAIAKKMYEAYENRAGYDILVETSEKLDQLLNELEIQKKTKDVGLKE